MPMLPLSHRPWRGGARAWALVILWSLAWLAVSPAPTVWSQEPAAKTDAAPAPAPAGTRGRSGRTRPRLRRPHRPRRGGRKPPSRRRC